MLARNDRAGAQTGVNCLVLPPVTTATFSFKEVESELEQEQVPGPQWQGDERGALSPKSVSADTPVTTIDAWNVNNQVSLLLVCKTDFCGA